MAYYTPSQSLAGVAGMLAAIPAGYKAAQKEQELEDERQVMKARQDEAYELGKRKTELEMQKAEADLAKSQRASKSAEKAEYLKEFSLTVKGVKNAMDFERREEAQALIDDLFPGTKVADELKGVGVNGEKIYKFMTKDGKPLNISEDDMKAFIIGDEKTLENMEFKNVVEQRKAEQGQAKLGIQEKRLEMDKDWKEFQKNKQSMELKIKSMKAQGGGAAKASVFAEKYKTAIEVARIENPDLTLDQAKSVAWGQISGNDSRESREQLAALALLLKTGAVKKTDFGDFPPEALETIDRVGRQASNLAKKQPKASQTTTPQPQVTGKKVGQIWYKVVNGKPTKVRRNADGTDTPVQ